MSCFLKTLLAFVSGCFLIGCAAVSDKQSQPLSSSTPENISSTPSPSNSVNQKKAQNGRLASPDWIKCPRNNLTSFEGKVLSFERGDKHSVIRMEVDEETKKEFMISYSEQNKENEKFRLRGEPFTGDDWKVIESAKGKIRSDLRAVVWACYDDKNNLTVEAVDWRPPQQK